MIKNRWLLDRYFPDSNFLNELKFKKFISKTKGRQKLIVCSPNYLHTKHILMGIGNVMYYVRSLGFAKKKDLDKIILWEKINRNVFFVFQLRHDKSVLEIKNYVDSKFKMQKLNI